ncbi:hypothetical protein OESDEN_03311 [Oesophagostomum dentatum]|uniref:7TM GPCR serpentine receptor class x (Srx) domain-containing protein n=1 Tax=Oesophagostomum dentatum TaxID=61180 RepID=A0A0B1TGR4_OESDE|nr:hypothetical protein OESDEN_03311 [Oesophagostomum dentatum]
MDTDCKFISNYLDFYKDLTLVIIIAAVDIITMIKVRITSVKLRKSGVPETSSRRMREINFLKQAVLQGIVFMMELYTYFHLAWQVQNKWAIFAFTTVAWNLVHCTDALIIIGFNKEFRKLVSSPTHAFSRFFNSPEYGSLITNQDHVQLYESLITDPHSTTVDRVTVTEKY